MIPPHSDYTIDIVTSEAPRKPQQKTKKAVAFATAFSR
jgi:hypothetical protein